MHDRITKADGLPGRPPDAFGGAGGTAAERPELAAEGRSFQMPMVSKILKLLVREGLLMSHRGV